jgi:hypothetical protein
MSGDSRNPAAGNRQGFATGSTVRAERIPNNDLASRIRRAHLIFELVDIDHDHGDLFDEVAEFNAVCNALARSWGADD